MIQDSLSTTELLRRLEAVLSTGETLTAKDIRARAPTLIPGAVRRGLLALARMGRITIEGEPCFRRYRIVAAMQFREAA
ncbi:MAG TPA: hypothetical protein VNZ94_01895 [Xanthobacteraceae bacterium]|nr:hypothetical protein [Xanthobacteraceae bacterium]